MQQSLYGASVICLYNQFLGDCHAGQKNHLKMDIAIEQWRKNE